MSKTKTKKQKRKEKRAVQRAKSPGPGASKRAQIKKAQENYVVSKMELAFQEFCNKHIQRLRHEPRLFAAVLQGSVEHGDFIPEHNAYVAKVQKHLGVNFVLLKRTKDSVSESPKKRSEVALI